MKKIIAHVLFLSCTVLLSPNCKKSSTGTSKISLFHKDITIHEMVGSSEQAQMCLGFFQLNSNPGNLVFVASRGIFEANGGQGFRAVGLQKDSTVSWIKSYALPNNPDIQYATCATIDQDDNTWVGGHLFEGPLNYGKPFLVKLDKTGNILWSRALVDSAHTSRGVAIKALHNGDIAYLTFDGNYILYRLSTDGNVIWSKIISSTDSLQFGPSYLVYDNLYFNSHLLAEGADGSIFFASNSNAPVYGKDCLVKFSGNGNFIFAKTYAWPGNANSVPPQIQITENDDIIFADHRSGANYGATLYPFLFITSQNGDLKASKAFPLNLQVGWLRMNELNYFQQKIYLSTAGFYQFNEYIYDQSLNLLSSTKTIGTNTFDTDYGGMSLYDKTSGSLYHILNIAGLPADGNGFQFLKTDLNGKSCHLYSDAPVALSMTDISATVGNLALPVTDGSKSFTEVLSWSPYPVAISSSELACSQ